MDDSALVVLIGQTVWHQLFGQYANPIGAMLIVKGTPLRVIGVLGSKGQSSFGTDQDDLVMIPFSTAERKVLGVAAPSQATQANSLYGTLSNPYGIQPRLTGFVNQIYVQAVTPRPGAAGRRPGHAYLGYRAITFAPATPTTSPSAISARSRTPRRAAARPCPISLRPWPRSLFWWAGSAS